MVGSIWPFLKDPANIAVLGSIGAGIATFAAGVWAVFTFFANKKEKGASPPSVTANHGSVAAGRDITGPVYTNTRGDSVRADHGIVGSITNSTITINNIPPEQLEALVQARIRPYQETSEAQKKLIVRLETDLDLNERQLRAAFGIVGEANVPSEQLAAKLIGIAGQIMVLRAENEQLRRGPPALAAIAEEVQALIEKGEFDDARRALTRGREASRALRIDASRYEAAFLAQEARVDALQLAYRTAAVKYAEAAALVAPFDTEQQWSLQVYQALALNKQGDEFGDNDALAEAIDIYRQCLALVPRSERTLDWAGTQNDLGNALARLGERERGTARLVEAVAAYREALQEWTRDRMPLQWAGTQMNLGNMLQILGDRESGTARLEEAVAAYRESLQENTRERVPLGWAMTQMNLGNTLQALGSRESGTARLEEAVAAYREALQEYTRARAPLEWATTQMNLGNALATLGGGTARLEEAVAAYREALQEKTRERVPLQWATTQMNLGNALRVLGERESGTARLEEAVGAYREALQENTRARVPLDWAFTQMNLALVYRAFFGKDHQARHLDDALEAADGALEEFRKAKADFYSEKAERQRETILTAKGKL